MKRMAMILISVLALIFSWNCTTKMIVYARDDQEISFFCAEPLSYSAIENTNESIPETFDNTITAKINQSYFSHDSNIKVEILDCDTCIEITLEEYLIRVVMSEMPYTFEKEALRAQAVAARTYTLKLFEDGTRHSGNTVCTNPAHCSAGLDMEAYIKKYGSEAYEKAYEAAKEAVKSTDGVVIMYNGELCTAVYHSASGRSTENSYNLWGTYTPYLLSVETFEEYDAQEIRVDAKWFADTFFDGNGEVSKPKLVLNDTGRCERITFGNAAIDSTALRNVLGLKSCDFSLSEEDDMLIFTVYGYGHGIGMSQHGANEMAKNGALYTDILKHYYTGIEVTTLT